MAILLQNSHMINAEVYISGTSRSVGFASVDLPEINYMTNDTKGAGIGGQIAVSTRGMYESMELTLHWRTPTGDSIELAAHDSHNLEIYGAVECFDTASGARSVRQCHVSVIGFNKSFKLGKFEPAAESDTELTLEVVVLRLFIDGNKVIEIDKANYIAEFNGTDYNNDLRRALGLTM